MTIEEFRILTRGALADLVMFTSATLRRHLPSENIKLVSFKKVLAEGWDDSVEFLVSNVYFAEDKINPCVDLVVRSFEKDTTSIGINISSHQPQPFGLNWTKTAGPYVKAVSSDLKRKFAKNEFPD